jgi:hypothetical protein
MLRVCHVIVVPIPDDGADDLRVRVPVTVRRAGILAIPPDRAAIGPLGAAAAIISISIAIQRRIGIRPASGLPGDAENIADEAVPPRPSVAIDTVILCEVAGIARQSRGAGR